ncbi:hypothetical protein QFC19_007469 [Naganishia cerealis]|uniref:Uncharacterized protein n=1 Tax=Naganishia cerealis TaxID=610337 RepID=A0ACC2VAU6_9TREE|nr:hypothetical protein QFC19_007469 [Naganishia cerealis]
MDKSLDDSISSRRGSDRKPARGASSREGGSARSTPTSARTPYQRPVQRSTADAWTHDMYGGAGNAPKVVHVPRNDAANNTRLLITNVHYEVTVDDLKGIFSRVGTIIKGPTIQYDRSGRSTGIVNLQYSTPREARDAINSFDGNLAKGVGSPAVGAERNGRGGTRGREGGDVPRGLARGYRRGGPARGQGTRGGRNSERKQDVNADDLDKDLEAYLKAPAADDAPVKDGDVDMS